ncbi:replicative DNA helicase [Marinilongibacter aquaticus]|uniref:replicative DNA helicase n=1 Tax=Marinilongibacter aquaticus TaxID=2975157 RepID=UPI0021BD44D8|nr:replicative DNA helicase [Marinilongibacter aquaticus]UBM59561.1 replicative DNA helicase [Marinilongibacter aquaticus]
MSNEARVQRTFVQPFAQSDGQTLPFSEEVEAAVLGAVLIEKEALGLIKELVKINTFYGESHREIYSAMLELHEASEPIDLLTVTQSLRRRNTIRKVGGAKYLADLLSKVNSASNIEYHALIISQLSIKREMIQAANDLMGQAFDESVDIFEVLDNTEQYFFKISEQSIRRQYKNSNEIMRLTIDELENKKLSNEDGITGVPSGFNSLDELTGGWQKTELTIIAARPGMGKTAFVVSAMRNAAVDAQAPVAIFSLEMSATQLMLRMISAEAEIESEKLRKGILQPHEWQQLTTRLNKLNEAPIYIDDTPALSVLELRAKCRRLKAQFGIEMVIIDYLQLMSGEDGSNSQGNREQEIATISRALKNLAKELDVPVLALSQLSRAVETRGGDKRPQLSDLRESGSIEQDADMVMFLYRPEYYKLDTDENGNSTEGIGEVIIAKNRAGTLKTVKLQFVKEFTKFTDIGTYSANYFSGGRASMPDITQSLSDFEQRGSGSLPNATFLKSRANNTETNGDGLDQVDPNNDDVPF